MIGRESYPFRVTENAGDGTVSQVPASRMRRLEARPLTGAALLAT